MKMFRDSAPEKTPHFIEIRDREAKIMKLQALVESTRFLSCLIL